MRNLITTIAIGLVAALFSTPPAVSQDNTHWEDLLARDLKDWSRTGDGKSPWRLNAGRSLICTPAEDTYIPEREFADGTFKFEYRFLPTEHNVGYKASFELRKSLTGSGCKISLGDDCGSLSASIVASSDRAKTLQETPGKSPAMPIGYWNRVQAELKGKTITVRINGQEVASFNKCDTQTGMITLNAEGWGIEFRNVKWKEAN